MWGGAIKDANVADTIVRKNRAQLIAAAGVKGAMHCDWVCATLFVVVCVCVCACMCVCYSVLHCVCALLIHDTCY